jgi:regulator of protease activity HflC (stomatin/prohibitin superfamily)
MQNLQIDEVIVNAQTGAMAERVRAEAYRDALELIANGYSTAQGLGMSKKELHAEALRHLLNTLSSNPKFSALFNRELNELFSYLRNN